MPTNMSVYSWFSHDLEIMPIRRNRSTIGDHLYWLNLIFLPSRPSVKHIIGSLTELQDTLLLKNKEKQTILHQKLCHRFSAFKYAELHSTRCSKQLQNDASVHSRWIICLLKRTEKIKNVLPLGAWQF